MLLKNNEVRFEEHDLFFLKKHGLKQATKLFLEHYKKTSVPFIRDTTQLSAYLGVRRKTLHNVVRCVNDHYARIAVPKSNGGTRILYAPSSCIKEMQRSILRHILRYIPVSHYATAYVEGRSLRDNAAPHVGKKYLLKMDITDFFGSISFSQVLSSAFNSNYFPKQIGYLLTTICCRKDFLPQGAPTSPALSNIVMKSFDENIGAWCKERGITYTRYCDDLTFSSDSELYHVFKKASAMLEEMGFEVNEKKTGFITNASRQSVTGIVVNEKISIPRDYKRQLRQEVYYVLKYGLEESIMMQGRIEFAPTDYIDGQRYLMQLIGKVDYVLSIEPDNVWFENAKQQLLNVRCW